jgi:hypothetical protein
LIRTLVDAGVVPFTGFSELLWGREGLLGLEQNVKL